MKSCSVLARSVLRLLSLAAMFAWATPVYAGIYHIEFLIDPHATLLPAPDQIKMDLTTDDVLHNTGVFTGFLVTAIGGTSTEDGKTEALKTTPFPFNFNGLTSDNLYNPSGYPYGAFVDAAGIGFETVGGDQYQLFIPSVGGTPFGSVSGGATVSVAVPEPPSLTLMIVALLSFGWLAGAAPRLFRGRDSVV
jgi:hypothetical protein